MHLRPLLAAVIAFAFSLSAHGAERPVILAFGDSLTAGYGVAPDMSYPAQLQKLLDQRGYNYRVVNQGIAGNTTAQGLGRLQRALALQPEIVILQFGGNDAAYGFPAALTRENFRKMIERFKAGGTRVYLATRNLTSSGSGLYAELAREEHVELIPFLDGVAGQPDLLLQDGMHPTGEGYAIVVQNVFKVIEPVVRGNGK